MAQAPVSTTVSNSTSNEGLGRLRLDGLGTPAAVLLILGMMTLPLPPFLLDMLFTFNIAMALVVLLVTLYILKPLEFAAFPTVLLITTLMRLALNVGSTRVVLMEGHNGAGAAGSVIEAFGSVLVGGNYAVGIVVFGIFVIINFVVVTKGAGRISEVSARFTLDALPGKQMAIDADLNAGLINQDDARSRRAEVAHEADFYGAMDGASKFVRGDAVAGILILFINLIGGIAIGVFQHDLEFAQAAKFYALLTIGDGLVAQIPALLLSTGAAIMVTRQNSSQDMAGSLVKQMFHEPKALKITGGILLVMGLVPGMPHLAFLTLSGMCFAGAYGIKRKNERLIEEQVQQQQLQAEKPREPEARELGWDDVAQIDAVGLEVGYRLIPLVDKNQDGKLMARIKGVRKKLSQDLGFLIPSVHIRDNLDLAPNAYRITLMGVTAGEADIHIERELAINPGQVFGELQGNPTKDPAFGLPAVWIDAGTREHAQALGYTVVDASTVVATHLSQVLQSHAAELIGHEEVEQLLKQLSKNAPKLVEQLTPNSLPLSTVVRVLQNLLRENVPVRDMRTIAETLIEQSARTQDANALTAGCRVALARLIVQNINGPTAELPVITLAPNLEQLLQKSLQTAGEEGSIEPGLAERLQKSLQEAGQRQEVNGQPSVLLTSPGLRSTLARFARFVSPGMHVLSYQEIPDSKQVKIVATVG